MFFHEEHNVTMLDLTEKEQDEDIFIFPSDTPRSKADKSTHGQHTRPAESSGPPSDQLLHSFLTTFCFLWLITCYTLAK